MAELMLRYDTPEQRALLSPAEQALEQMEAFTIDSVEMAQVGADERGSINDKLKANENARLTIIRKIDEAKEPVNNLFKPVTELLMRARAIIDRKLITWNEKQAKEKAQLEAAANEKLRKEQEKLAVAAEKADLKGKPEQAAALREVANAMPTTVVLPSPPKATGMSERITYGAECTDTLLLAAFVVANPMFRELIAVNGPALNALARSQKDAFAVPGCRLVKKAGIASR